MMNKKKICMLVFNEVTSDPRVTKEAASLMNEYELSVVGIQRSTAIPMEEDVLNYKVYRVVAREEEKVTKMSLSTIGNKIIQRFFSFVMMGQLALRLKADIYHAHDFEMLPIAYLVAKWRKAQFIYDSHELWVEQRADFPLLFKRVVRMIEGFLIKRVDKVITVNESIALELMNRYHLKAKPTIVRNFTPKLELEQKRPCSERIDKILVLYHGGYSKDRGLEELIQSVDYFPENVILRFRGMGPIEETLRDIAQEHIQSGKVEFCPPVPMKYLVEEARLADIGVIPYKPTCLNNYYSLPNKLSEYVMAGLAVCASDLPEINRLNNQVSFGELFDPYDPISIGQAIEKLSSDPVYLKQCKFNARSWAEQEGNWGTESIKLLDCYSQIAGEMR